MNMNTTEITEKDLCLPADIFCTVGREMNIYYYNILRCTRVEDYCVRVAGVCREVRNLGDRLCICMSEPQDKLLIFEIRRNNALLFSRRVTLHCCEDRWYSPVRLLMIGDSLVERGCIEAELLHMAGSSLTLYGTRSGVQADAQGEERRIAHEGRSSWHTAHYFGASNGTVDNAFFCATRGTFDFSYYIEKNPSFADLTDVTIQLGTNDIGNVPLPDYLANLRRMVESILDFRADIRVYLSLIPPPVRDGYAWGSRNFSDVLGMKDSAFAYVSAVMSDPWLSQHCYRIPLYLNLDCFCDFPKTMVPRSARNPEPVEVCDDNVHPAPCGFFKFADVYYNVLLAANQGKIKKENLCPCDA